jgi:hypothetical protein
MPEERTTGYRALIRRPLPSSGDLAGMVNPVIPPPHQCIAKHLSNVIDWLKAEVGAKSFEEMDEGVARLEAEGVVVEVWEQVERLVDLKFQQEVQP